MNSQAGWILANEMGEVVFLFREASLTLLLSLFRKVS